MVPNEREGPLLPEKFRGIASLVTTSVYSYLKQGLLFSICAYRESSKSEA